MLRKRPPERTQHSRRRAVLEEAHALRDGEGFEGIYNRAVECEPEITAEVKAAAKQAGMDMAGVENRIKSRDSYLNKITRKYDSNGGRYEVKDILRYTYTASPEEFAEKVLKAIELYDRLSYNTVEIKNYWLDRQSPYNGINTILRSPGGQAFELQYHTPESFQVKNGKMHELYEKQRHVKDVGSRAYIELGDQMFELSDSMEVPKGIEKVKNHE
ncbi:hypothetical protein AALB39_15720 [Lachnospiraceae bacterium 54-53]